MKAVDKKTKDGGDLHLRYYDDTWDFANKVQELIDEIGGGSSRNGLGCSSVDKGHREWTGSENIEEAMDMARNGWPEGLADLEDAANDVEEVYGGQRRLTEQLGVSGDYPCIASHLEGLPDDMITPIDAMADAPGKIIKLIVQKGTSSGTSAEQMRRSGAAYYLTIKRLLASGYSVELDIVFSFGRSGHRFITYVPVLRAGEPLNLDTLSFWLIHPSVLRRFLFATKEMENNDVRNKFGFYRGSGYARPDTFTDDMPLVYDKYLTLDQFPSDIDMSVEVDKLYTELTSPHEFFGDEGTGHADGG